jgi:hypothetical protein
MICPFDWCIFWSDLSLALFSILIAWTVSVLVQMSRQSKRYGKAEGKYIAYPYIKDTNVLNYNSPTADVTIDYVSENRLTIRLTERDPIQTWEGNILMESPLFGSIAWHYISLAEIEDKRERHRFGMKKVIVRENTKTNMMYVYLIGEDGYGKEILERPLSK